MKHAITFTGLDGANPLAFLSALGAFRCIDEIYSREGRVLMEWSNEGSAWRPVIWMAAKSSEYDLVKRLYDRLRVMANHPVLTFDKNLRLPPLRHRALAVGAVRAWFDGSDRMSCEFLSAFGCEGILDDKNLVQDTALRTMSGGGHQDYIKFMNDLAKDTTLQQLNEALFGPWRYADPGPSLRFDPLDDRRYALRWKNPGQDAIQTVRGANRLAVEGIPMLYTAPVSGKLETCGFTGHRSHNTLWSWPIWDTPVSLDVCRSLISQRELISTGDGVNREKHLRPGIAAIFRSQRITVGKYRNFTPSYQIA